MEPHSVCAFLHMKHRNIKGGEANAQGQHKFGKVPLSNGKHELWVEFWFDHESMTYAWD